MAAACGTSPTRCSARCSRGHSPLHALGFDPTANGDTVLLAIETGEPYPIRMLFIQSTNPIANMAADAPRVYNAMRSVDYNVVVDVFMTPTAVACADIVLPCGMSCERNSARVWWWPLRSIVKVADYYEAKSDEQIILELGKRLNPRLFPWETDVELMTWWIQSGNRFHAGWPHKTDQTFLDLTEKVIDWPDDWAYRKHELGWLRDDGQPGFNTNTGKCELYNTLFEAWGFDPLPYYEEPPESPISTPELFEEYPVRPTTGARTWEYFHSEERQVPRLRESHPDPLTDLHPDTAAKIGVCEGTGSGSRTCAASASSACASTRPSSPTPCAPSTAGGSPRPTAPSPTCSACSTRTSTT